MKTALSILLLLFGLAAFSRVDAQTYASRVIQVCPVCHKNVYAYYRPVSYNGVLRYTWVPAYHTSCAARRTAPVQTITRYHRGTPYNYIVPAPTVRVPYRSPSVYQHYSPRYSGYLRPGFSIRIIR